MCEAGQYLPFSKGVMTFKISNTNVNLINSCGCKLAQKLKRTSKFELKNMCLLSISDKYILPFGDVC